MSLTIYGPGTGLFNQSSAQTLFLKPVLARKKASVVGDGETIHDHVKIMYLVQLYKLVLLDVFDSNGQGQNLPSGKKGIIFSSHGEHSKIREAKLVDTAGFKLGLLPDQSIEHLSPEDGAREILPHVGFFTTEQIKSAGPQIVESVMAFNAGTVPTVAHGLG